MKKLFSLLLACMFTLAFVACGGGASTEETATEEVVEEAAETTEEVVEEAAEEVEEAAEEASEEMEEVVEAASDSVDSE